MLLSGIIAGVILSPAALVRAEDAPCNLSNAVVQQIQSQLLPVTQLPDGKGGIFTPNRMWSAVVDRQGRLCSVINTNATNGDAWPGSRAIAIAKAETANDFSNSALALSTANLYGPPQPG